MALAGSAGGTADAATTVGRALAVGPQVRVREDDDVVEVAGLRQGTDVATGKRGGGGVDGRVASSREVCAYDYALVEMSNRRILMMLSQIEAMRGGRDS